MKIKYNEETRNFGLFDIFKRKPKKTESKGESSLGDLIYDLIYKVSGMTSGTLNFQSGDGMDEVRSQFKYLGDELGTQFMYAPLDNRFRNMLRIETRDKDIDFIVNLVINISTHEVIEKLLRNKSKAKKVFENELFTIYSLGYTELSNGGTRVKLPIFYGKKSGRDPHEFLVIDQVIYANYVYNYMIDLANSK